MRIEASVLLAFTLVVDGTSSLGASCSSHDSCSSLGLSGDCCPTPDGINLGCCTDLSSPSSQTLTFPPSPGSTPPSSDGKTPDNPSIFDSRPSPLAPPSPPPAPPISLLGGQSLGSNEPFFRSVTRKFAPSSAWGTSFQRPYPTNEWWQDVVLLDGTSLGSDVITTLPYIMQAHHDGLHFCVSGDKVVTQRTVLVDFIDAVAFGSVEPLKPHTVSKFDQLSVTLEWKSTSANSSMETPLVRGMPYISTIYHGLTPSISFVNLKILEVNGASPEDGATDTLFHLKFTDGSKWLLHSSEQLTLKGSDSVLSSTAPLFGFMRMAASQSRDHELALKKYVDAIPIGGSVNAIGHGDQADVMFEWTVQGSGELLMLMLPHHADLISGVTHDSISYDTMKGFMKGVVGQTWKLTHPLPDAEWTAANPVNASLRKDIMDAVYMDMQKQFVATDPYGGGKELAAVARLALIAEELGLHPQAHDLCVRLSAQLEFWFTGSNPDSLLYDETWGGVISSNGLHDDGADFGNGRYNDHHFHYGYFIYASAVVAKTNSTFASKWSNAVLHMIRDVANPSADDHLYPVTRYKDWYAGHSWASGLFPSASSRNQESVPEALNAWYGIALWGKATSDARLYSFGRLLMASEIRSAWRYWQISTADGPSIYPQPFSQNMLVGCLWSTKAEYSTWFGANVEFIYGIQLLPITPAMETLLRPEWVADSLHVWSPVMLGASEQWRAFLIAAYAVLKPVEAWDLAKSLKIYDAGNSRANQLYWIATRRVQEPRRANASAPMNNESDVHQGIRSSHTQARPVFGRIAFWTLGMLLMSVAAYSATRLLKLDYGCNWLQKRRLDLDDASTPYTAF